MPEDQAKLARARGYPYAIPEGSYLWRGGEVAAFDPKLRKNRTPVLAIGSNQSPDQLTRKFGDMGEIPVQRGWLRDFDIYYSAHISAYGSVPAMLQRAPDADATLSVNWLDDRQLDVMHGTELAAAKYKYAVIEDIGHLMHDGDAVALSAMPAKGRRPKALTTAEVLEVVRERFSPADGADTFVLKLVDDPDFRAACTKAISSDAVSFAHPARPATGKPGPAAWD
jgi:hypothetical protein